MSEAEPGHRVELVVVEGGEEVDGGGDGDRDQEVVPQLRRGRLPAAPRRHQRQHRGPEHEVGVADEHHRHPPDTCYQTRGTRQPPTWRPARAGTRATP